MDIIYYGRDICQGLGVYATKLKRHRHTIGLIVIDIKTLREAQNGQVVDCVEVILSMHVENVLLPKL